VTQKAFAMGFRPIVVINKIDRPGARSAWVLDRTFDLFDRLGATDEQLDFPVIYASALHGYAGLTEEVRSGDMTPLFETIVSQVSPPQVDREGPFQLQVSSLGYNSYVGVIGIGRIRRGKIKTNTPVVILDRHGNRRNGRVLQVLGFQGLERIEFPEASAGDIIAFTGIDGLGISDVLCDPNCVESLPPLKVDEPAMSMTFQVNTSPFAGRDGKVRHQSPSARAVVSGADSQRRIADRGHRRPGQIQGLRARRTASVDPDREHAPRGL
jgi:GTP-binding protein